MDPTAALRSIETALRLVTRQVLGDEWLAASGAPDKAKLEQRREEESKRRDGAVVSSNLLDYTETYDLTELVRKNWEKFKPVFDDQKRTFVYFGAIEDVRNSIAHSRDLVPFERELISGIAGQLRNQVSLFRSARDGSVTYYPLIESLKDGFGTEGNESFESDERPSRHRLDVGQTLSFTGTAFSARQKTVKWHFVSTNDLGGYISQPGKQVAEGDSVTFDYTIRVEDVGEYFPITIYIVADSQFHRHKSFDFTPAYDDNRYFEYSVNPPD